MSKLDAKMDQVKGGLKEVAGKVTDNKEMQAEGTVEKLAGKVKEGLTAAKDAVSDVIDNFKN